MGAWFVLLSGIVTLTSSSVWQEVAAAHDLCRMADVRLLSPYLEGLRPNRSISGGCHQVSPWTEMAMDERMGGEKILGLIGRFESMLLTLSSSRWPM